MKICNQCHLKKSETEYTSRYAKCKECLAKEHRERRTKEKASREYDASTIKILSSKDFDFSHVHDLAHEYNKPLIFIQRGIEACRRSGIDKSYFIKRYLQRDKSVIVNPSVEQAYQDILNEAPDVSIHY